MKHHSISPSNLAPCSVGCLSYWSFLPLVSELRRLTGKMDLRLEQPSQLNHLLTEHDIDLGFCSVTSLSSRSDLELALPIGEAIYGSYGPAYLSICEADAELRLEIKRRLTALKEAFQNPAIRSHWLDSPDYFWQISRRVNQDWAPLAPNLKICGSTSSAYVSLAKLIYRLVFGEHGLESMEIHANNTHDDGASLELRCGNEAMSRRCCHANTIDIVDVWYDLSGLPFVPHVLLKDSRSTLSQAVRTQLSKASELAQAKMHVDPSAYLPDIPPVNYHGQDLHLSLIWKHVSYRLTAESLKSIRFFLQLVRPFEPNRDSDESFHLKMARWKQREFDTELMRI